MGKKLMKLTRRVMDHSLIRSLIRSHRSLIRLLRTASFARALCRAHSLARLLARSLTHSLPSSWESGFCLWNECINFIQFQPTVHWSLNSSDGPSLLSFSLHPVVFCMYGKSLKTVGFPFRVFGHKKNLCHVQTHHFPSF